MRQFVTYPLKSFCFLLGKPDTTLREAGTRAWGDETRGKWEPVQKHWRTWVRTSPKSQSRRCRWMQSREGPWFIHGAQLPGRTWYEFLNYRIMRNSTALFLYTGKLGVALLHSDRHWDNMIVQCPSRHFSNSLDHTDFSWGPRQRLTGFWQGLKVLTQDLLSLSSHTILTCLLISYQSQNQYKSM